MKIVTVVGARPQFIKAAAISRAIQEHNSNSALSIDEKIIHTGQHYDDAMSEVFFEELKIPRPWKNLAVGSGSHGKQTGMMMERLEEVVNELEPDILLTFGDTNSTLASALVAAKLHIPIAHVEAGLRSFNRKMPEEINRVLTDHISEWLFCPSKVSQENLKAEGIVDGVHVVGDVMYDAMKFHLELAEEQSEILKTLSVAPGEYCVATIHRAETTDSKDTLCGVIEGLSTVGGKVVLPLHPRTKNKLSEHDLSLPSNVVTVPPLSYLDMLKLVAGSQFVLTDSGGLQKEAYWLQKRCITLRTETEWTELVDCGWNQVVGTDPEQIRAAVSNIVNSKPWTSIYGDGTAANKIIDCLSSHLG
jgi:UDP-N-acetylglucosamine 2-epimerase